MRVPALVVLPFVLFAVLSAEEIQPEFHAVCPYDQQLCSDYDAFKSRLWAVTAADNQTLTELNETLIDISKRTDKLAYDQQIIWPLKDHVERIQGIFAAIGELRVKLSVLTLANEPQETAEISRHLLEVERSADMLVSEIPGKGASADSWKDFARRVSTVNDRAMGVWRELQSLSLNVDRIGSPVSIDHKVNAGGQIWMDRINPLEERVAALRDEMRYLSIVLDEGGHPATASGSGVNDAQIDKKLKERGLGADLFEKRSLEDMPGGQAVASAQIGLAAAGVNLTVSPKTLLDLDTPPMPVSAKPLTINGGKSYVDDDGHVIHEDAHPWATRVASFMHAVGLSKTDGDAAGRVRYGFRQTGGTCALASQAQMFAELHGIEPTTQNLKRLEDIFFEQARQKKFFTGNSADHNQRTGGAFGGGGTADQYAGDLLDAPVKKHFLAPDAELAHVVASGKMVQVAVNAMYLWNDPGYKGGHAIVVTAVERSRLTGRVLGYYINDTGADEAGRFVSAAQFYKAWHDRGSQFVEAL